MRKSTRVSVPVLQVNQNPENFESDASTDRSESSSDSDGEPLSAIAARLKASNKNASKKPAEESKKNKSNKKRTRNHQSRSTSPKHVTSSDAAAAAAPKKPVLHPNGKPVLGRFVAATEASSSSSSSVPRPGKAKLSKKKSKRKEPQLTLSLMQSWGAEGQDAGAGKAYKPPKAAPARGASQSRVPGDVNAKPAAQARDRSVTQRKPPQHGKSRMGGTRTTDLSTKGMSAKRVEEWPGQSFVVKGEKLICQCCNAEVSNKASSTKQHVKSKTKARSDHEANLDMFEMLGTDRETLCQLIDDYDEKFNPTGTTLDKAIREHRVEVLCTLLEAGVPINKINEKRFRKMLERSGGSSTTLTSASHLMELMAIPRELQRKTLKEELKGKSVVVIWDGTTRVAEVYVVVVRFWANGKVQQRVAGLRLLSHPLTGPENVGVLMDIMGNTGVGWVDVLEFAADRAATNQSAFDILKGLASNAFLAGCVPHTLSHVGENSDLDVLRMFTFALTIMTHSTNARTCFARHFGETMKRFNKIRWYVRYEMQKQIALNWTALAPWLAECELVGHAPESVTAMRAVLNANSKTLQLELAISMDAYDLFVRCTYTLEGDSVLVFKLVDLLDELTAHVQIVRGGGAGTPNTRALAKKIVDDDFGHLLQAAKDAKVNALIQESLVKVERSFAYFEEKMVELDEMVQIFKASRLFDPSRIAALAANVNEVERQLTLFPFFDAPTVALLVAGLPAYIARVAATPLARDADGDFTYERWWADCEGEAGLGDWFSAATKVLILQPSSAAAERIFSMLKALMGDQQQARALEDYQEAAIMTRYNQLQRYKV
jgi:hypothetical protein